MNTKISTGLTLLAILLSVFFVAPAAQAASLTAAQVQAIVSLLQSFGVDASTISNVESALGTSSAPSTTSCLTLSYNLYAGITDADTNGEVTQLQQFLGVTPSTGYFGSMTLQAVQAWQAGHGIVSSGSPDTTGYGFVGPATRAAMECGAGKPAISPKLVQAAAPSVPTSSESPTSTSASWTTYTNKEYGFGIRYPADVSQSLATNNGDLSMFPSDTGISITDFTIPAHPSVESDLLVTLSGDPNDVSSCNTPPTAVEDVSQVDLGQTTFTSYEGVGVAMGHYIEQKYYAATYNNLCYIMRITIDEIPNTAQGEEYISDAAADFSELDSIAQTFRFNTMTEN